MRIHLDREKCTGLGICEGFAPDVFEVDDEGDLVLRMEEIDDTQLAAVEQAVGGCPTQALRLEP